MTGQNLMIGASPDDLVSKNKFLDWSKFVDLRPAWTDRFNREIRV